MCDGVHRKGANGVECHTAELSVEAGTSLLEIARQLKLEGIEESAERPIIAAYENNRMRELSHRIYSAATIEYVDLSSFEGMKVYQRTLNLVLQCAVEELMPQRRLHIRHSMGLNGFYCEIEEQGEIVRMIADEVDAIAAKMREIVAADIEIARRKLPTEEVRTIYAERGFADKLPLLDTRPRLYSELYMLKDTVNYFYGPLAPATGYVPRFEVQSYYQGFYLAMPCRVNLANISASPQQEKMFRVFRLHQRWVDIVGVQNVGALNAKIMAGDTSEMIKLAEALMERAISSTADEVAAANRERGCRIVLLAGPSSSGKTTTSMRLGVHLQVLGYKPLLISLDDYFVDRHKTPKDANGEYDYEALEAINLKLFNDNLSDLLAGKSVDIPRYDFISGISRKHEKPLQLQPNTILIIEGIHGLNPELTPAIDPSLIFRIYASCFTTIAMDDTSHISSSDNRLLRRLTRDYTQRGSSGQSTLQRWASVRRGEEKHIFPYQENADRMINTAMFYELPVIKPYAEKILREVPNTGVEYDLAARLLKFLDQFVAIDPAEIPQTSTLREFIGGGSFKY